MLVPPLPRRYSPALPGDRLPGSVDTLATYVSSFSSCHSLPYRSLFSDSRLHKLSWHGHATVDLWAFALAVLLARRISKQADKNKQQTRSTHSNFSFFRTQIMWHKSSFRLPFLAFYSRVCLFSESLPPPALHTVGKAIALSWHVKLYGSWYTFVHPLNGELFDKGGTFFVLHLEQYLAQEGFNK